MRVPSAVGDLLAGHVTLGGFFSAIGFVGAGALADSLPQGLVDAILEPSPFSVSLNGQEMWGILRHNLLFFLVVSLLPVVNAVFFAIQCVLLGVYAFLIANLSLAMQVEMFYRHAVFEVAALVLAVGISYTWLLAVNHFISAQVRDIPGLLGELRPVVLWAALLVAFVVLGALLEGSASVQLS
jgi:hypothetical protein